MEYIVDIRKLLKAIHNSKKILVEKEKNKQLILLVNDLKNILTETEFIVNNNNSIQAKIDSTKKELEELAVKEKVLRLLVKELSPNEGLIAKSINSFLNIFLSDMNVIINSVWSYQMEILPFDLTESEDLDYKFPIRVNNSEVIEDISKLSSSMMEIIDLAFRIVYVKYGNLQHYPLILDEFGRTFDQQHRTYGYDIIDKILSSSFKQIFIVSHFEESYLRFSHGDISILNTTNLDISNISNYNQVLTLE
jgi:DNA repair exonuclease SbcCD ATPase subunit